jgi:hypothetical protein
MPSYEAHDWAHALSERLPDGAWAGRRCFIVGGGPSLKGFDFNRLRGERVIAINKAFYDVPFADILFAMDRPLLDLIRDGKLGEEYQQAFESFYGLKLWLDLSGYSYPAGVYSIPSAGETGWTKSLSEGLFHGQNSGYGALNLALVLGANPIYLLGYDCSRGPAGEKNYHGGYPGSGKPNAVDIFLKAFKAGAAMLDGITQSRIVNLNPHSALRCFRFDDIDKVLPVSPPNGDRITAVTLTGDRPLAFGLCERWMAGQTRQPDQWVVIDDGKTPMAPLKPTLAMRWFRREPQPHDPRVTLDLNMKTALPLIEGDKIVIIEDDEYYAPRYIEEMARRLDSYEVDGIGDSRYYHLPTGGYDNCGNMQHASLAQTAFRASFIPVFTELVLEGSHPRWLDDRLWQRLQASRGTAKPIPFLIFTESGEPLYVGMKGLPGRAGIGAGHNPAIYRRQRDDDDRTTLKRWIPRDYQVYLDILAGMK